MTETVSRAAVVRRTAVGVHGAGNASARVPFAAVRPARPAAAVTGVQAGAIGQQITVAVNTTFNTVFTELGRFPANPISGLLEGALVVVRRTVFGLVPTGVTATLNGSTLAITVDPGSTAYFRQDGLSLQVSGDPVFFRLLNEQQFTASSVQAVTATGTGHAGFVFTTGDVKASLDTTGIDSVNFGAGALFGDSVTTTLDSGTLVLYNAVRGMSGVTLDAPAIRLATDVSVEALDDPGDQTSVPNVTFTGTVDATTTGNQSLTVTALGTTTFMEAVGSKVKLASLLTQGITPLDIPQIPGTSQTIPLYYTPLYSATEIEKVAHAILVSIGNNPPQLYTFDAGGEGFSTGYNETLWNGVPLVGPPETESFGSGTVFSGPGVTTPITIGVGTNPVTTQQPIRVLAGTSVTQNGEPIDFTNPYVGAFITRFFGDFGVSFSNNSGDSVAPLSSAMWQLPGNLGNGFLVQLGPIGNANQVTVGPTSALIEQFPFAIAIPEAVPSATYPGTDNPVLVKGPYDVAYTVTVEGQEPQQYGGTTNPILSVFDTGTPETVFQVLDPPHSGQLPVGSTVSATFINALDPSDPLLWSFTVGTTPAVNMAAYSGAGSSADEKIILGLNIYNDFDVLFDAHTQLIYLRPNGGGATVNLQSVTTTGAQSYQQGNVILDGTYTIDRGTFSVAGTTTLAGATTGINAGTGAVSFSGTVDGTAAGAQALVVTTRGATTFIREVGFSTALSSVSVTGGGSTATAAVTTTGSQSYGGDVSLNGPYVTGGGRFTIVGATTLVGPVSVSTNDGDITFGGTIDATTNTGFPLTVTAGDKGVIEFKGAVGSAKPLGGLAIDSAKTVTASGTVSLDGSLGYSSGEGLQIGSTDSTSSVGTANFTGGGLIAGFQTNGGNPNGTCSDERIGACGSGVVVNGTPSGSIQGFLIADNASYGIYVPDSPSLTYTGNNFTGNANGDVGPITAQ